MDGSTTGMGVTIKPRFLQATSPAALIDGDHAMRLRMQEAGLDGPRVGTVSEEGHGTLKVTKDGRKFHWPLLRIPTQVAQVGRVRQENPVVFNVRHSYSFLE